MEQASTTKSTKAPSVTHAFHSRRYRAGAKPNADGKSSGRTHPQRPKLKCNKQEAKDPPDSQPITSHETTTILNDTLYFTSEPMRSLNEDLASYVLMTDAHYQETVDERIVISNMIQDCVKSLLGPQGSCLVFDTTQIIFEKA